MNLVISKHSVNQISTLCALATPTGRRGSHEGSYTGRLGCSIANRDQPLHPCIVETKTLLWD